MVNFLPNPKTTHKVVNNYNFYAAEYYYIAVYFQMFVFRALIRK